MQTENIGVFQGNVVNMWGANGNVMAKGHLIRVDIELSNAQFSHRVVSTPKYTFEMYK